MVTAMLTVRRFINRVIASPKTSIPGLVAILAAIGAIVKCHGSCLFDTNSVTPILSGLITGFGLLFAADHPPTEKESNERIQETVSRDL